MADLLVSCCMQQGGLFLVKTEDGMVERLREGNFRGIALTESRIFAGEDRSNARSTAGLLELDRSFSEVRRLDFPDPPDIHSLFAKDGRLYVGTNGWKNITVLDLSSLEPMGEIRLPNCSSVWVDDEVLYVSVHLWPGGKVPERHGAILALDRETSRILEERFADLLQPHSVVRWGEDLFYCVSGDRTLHRNGVPIALFRAYPRGLAMDESYYYVGQSQFRHDPGDRSECGVVVVDRKDGKRGFVPLPATEVFEVALLG